MLLNKFANVVNSLRTFLLKKIFFFVSDVTPRACCKRDQRCADAIEYGKLKS